MGVASIEALSGGGERAGPESTRVGTILRPASPACGLSLAGRSRHLAQYADVGGGVSLRRGLRRGIMIVPSGRIGMTYRLYYWPGIQGRGELVRLALEEAGVAYVDVGMDEAEGGLEAVQALLDAPGAVHPPFAPPVLVNGKLVLAQVAALLQIGRGGKECVSTCRAPWSPDH